MKEQKKISTRQIIIFYLIYTFAIKFVMLPHLLSLDSGSNGWISAIIGSVIELLVLFAVVSYLKGEEDIYADLRKKTTVVGAKIILFILFTFFMLQAVLTLTHTQDVLGSTIYENFEELLLVIPMLLLAIYFCYAPTRSVFRSGELFFVLIIVGLGLALLPAIDKVNFNELNMRGDILRGVLNNLIFFEGALILLMFRGDIKIEKHFTKKFMSWAVVGAVVFVAFVAIYYTIFGPLFIYKPLGVIDIAGQNSYISQNGRLDWIIVCIWFVLLVIRFGMLFFAAFASMRYVSHVRFQPAIIVFPLAIVIYVLFATDFVDLLPVWLGGGR